MHGMKGVAVINMAHHSDWQVHYNRDEDLWYFLPEPVTLESFHGFIDPIIERVDLYLLDPGSRAQCYPTKVSEMFGADEERWQALRESPPERSSPHIFEKQKEHFETMLELVGDPMAAILARCHEKGIRAGISYRMNDTHYWWLEDHYHFTRFCVEHRDWRMEDGGFDFAIDEVRRMTLDLLKEHCEHFDLDVLELDFTRQTQYFQLDMPQQEKFRLMNDLIKEVRDHALAVGQRRGRPILLQPRGPATIASWENIGLDVKTWIREGWIDAIVPAPPYSMEFDIPVEQFRYLDPTGRLPVYAGLEKCMTPDGGPRHHLSSEMVRGAIAKHARRGADGVHFFNSFAWDRRMELEALEDAGDPAGVAGKNKHYLLTLTSVCENHRKYGASMVTPLPANLPACPERSRRAGETAAPLTLDFLVPDDLQTDPPRALPFRVQFRGMKPEQSAGLQITVNGKALPGPGEWQPAYRAWMGERRDNNYMDPWLKYQTEPRLWRRGKNAITMKLSSPGQAQVILRGVELEVIY